MHENVEMTRLRALTGSPAVNKFGDIFEFDEFETKHSVKSPLVRMTSPQVYPKDSLETLSPPPDVRFSFSRYNKLPPPPLPPQGQPISLLEKYH